MSKQQVIIPADPHSSPYTFEVSAAIILARHFKQDVEFIGRVSSTTPDVRINNILWEIKSPTGNGKRTIQHQIHRALKQSHNIVFDARKIRLRITKVRKDLRNIAQENTSIKRLVLIEKDEKAVIIK